MEVTRLYEIVTEWCNFLIDLGATNVENFTQLMFKLQARYKHIFDSLSKAEQEKIMLAYKIKEMTEDEFLRYNEEVYVPLHPDWFRDMLVPDQEFIAKELLSLLCTREKVHGVIDIGSGPGTLDIFLASKGIIDGPIVCLDPLATSLQQGRDLAKRMAVDVEFQEGRITADALPFESESFELAIAIDSLHWTTHWKNGIKEMARLLKKDGVFYLFYSEHSPRIMIPINEAQNLIYSCGLRKIQTSRLRLQDTPSGSPRILITAIKN